MLFFLRIEETWTLWQTLMDDCRVFGDWLKVMEEEIKDASPDQSNVSVTKEEFRRCEVMGFINNCFTVVIVL